MNKPVEPVLCLLLNFVVSEMINRMKIEEPVLDLTAELYILSCLELK